MLRQGEFWTGFKSDPIIRFPFKQIQFLICLYIKHKHWIYLYIFKVLSKILLPFPFTIFIPHTVLNIIHVWYLVHLPPQNANFDDLNVRLWAGTGWGEIHRCSRPANIQRRHLTHRLQIKPARSRGSAWTKKVPQDSLKILLSPAWQCCRSGTFFFNPLAPGAGSGMEKIQSWHGVLDPNPDVFGPPGSGSVIILYGSGSFHQQAKKVRKTLISTTVFCEFCKCTLKK